MNFRRLIASASLAAFLVLILVLLVLLVLLILPFLPGVLSPALTTNASSKMNATEVSLYMPKLVKPTGGGGGQPDNAPAVRGQAPKFSFTSRPICATTLSIKLRNGRLLPLPKLKISDSCPSCTGRMAAARIAAAMSWLAQ